jgi:DNA (cytosine-5)-methyltransferase 1
MNELALFAGAGGGILGGKLLGWRTVCAVEWDDHARSVLKARQDDGCLDPFPIWDDVSTFDGKPWRGLVDVVSGGFPCQDISCAGKGAGLSGKRSGLWSEMSRIISEVRPRYVLVENSPMLTVRGLGDVLGDLAALGYDARWGVLGAVHAGAPHKRERIWIVADADKYERAAELQPIAASSDVLAVAGAPGIWEAKPGMDRVADGVPGWMDRINRLGNAQVPGVVPLAWQILSGD